MNLEEVKQRVEAGIGSRGVFGSLCGSQEEMLEAARGDYRTLVKACHPDFVSEEEKEAAAATFSRLRELYQAVTDQVKTGNYGKTEASPAPFGSVQTGLASYPLLQVIATGEVAKIYKSSYTDKKGQTRYAAIKIALEARDNHLIENEQNILRKLLAVLPPGGTIGIPRLADTFVTPDGLAGSVLEFVNGYDFHRLLDHPLYQKGLQDPYHIGWILERQLALLGYLHKNGIIHGNIEPSHLMLVPHNHNVVLLDFCFAVDEPSAVDRIRIFTPGYSAPEVQYKESPHPRMDLFGVGKCMFYLINGDEKKSSLPSDLPPPLGKLLRSLVKSDPDERADDAWKAAHELLQIRKAMGKKKFKPLPI